MSVIEKSLVREGLTLVADALPRKDRTVKTFQRLIAAIRATEAEVQDRLSDTELRLNESLQKTLELQDRCHKLEDLVRQYRIVEKLNSIESLTTADRRLLLEVEQSAVKANGA